MVVCSSYFRPSPVDALLLEPRGNGAAVVVAIEASFPTSDTFPHTLPSYMHLMLTSFTTVGIERQLQGPRGGI